MLQGPANNANGYFDDSFRNNYPTPNESSLRTGLTPGGGGSMFPAPSPNTQAIFNLQGGGATPGTLEFQRTAMNAAARSKGDNTTQNVTSQSSNPGPEYKPAQQAQQPGRQESYAHPESEAVNSLYMLAQTGTRNANTTNNNQFAAHTQHAANQNVTQLQRMQNQQQDVNAMHTRNKQSIDSMNSGGMTDGNDYDGTDGSPGQKSSSRAKGKKGSNGKNGQAVNGRRKADDTPSKAPPKKRSRANNGSAQPIDSIQSMDDDDDDSDTGSIKDEDGDQLHSSGRKMTDDEKRKNFLERNRYATTRPY